MLAPSVSTFSCRSSPSLISASVLVRVVCRLIMQAPLQRLGDREIRLAEATAAGGDPGPRRIGEHRACLRLQRQMKLSRYTSVPEL